MKHLKLLQLVVFISVFAVFTSCEKDDESEPKTIEAQLVGNWSGDEYYEDGQLSELNEFFKLMSTIEFNEDGTGSTSSLLGSQPLTWSYDETTEKLRIETETVDMGEGVTIEGKIIEGAEITKIDASNLWFTYQEDGITVEERYKK